MLAACVALALVLVTLNTVGLGVVAFFIYRNHAAINEMASDVNENGEFVMERILALEENSGRIHTAFGLQDPEDC